MHAWFVRAREKMKGAMKGIEDFIYVLVIAIALVAIFMIISVIFPYSGIPGGAGTEDIMVAEFSLGTVGFTETEPKSSDLGTFTVGEVQTEELKKVPQLEISAGWFGSNKEEFNILVPSHFREVMRDLVVTFNVKDTNEYANLNVEWNGKAFLAEKAPRGSYEVKIDANYIEDSNKLEVFADGPGLAFWAATVYTIRDFRVNLEYGPSRLVAFTLGQGDLDTFSKGELRFIGFGSSNMRVKINGVKIYDAVPDGVIKVGFNFTDAPLKLGENIMSLDCPTGQVTLNNARLDLYVLTNQVSRTRTFEMTDSQFNLMDKQDKVGSLRFRVESTTRPGLLDIELNGNDLTVDTVTGGWNDVTFTADEIQSGDNTVEFSGTGFWDISDVQVLIEK
jgi:hypothetical protein